MSQPTLFTNDQIPACEAGPVLILRRMEARIEALKKRLAETPDPSRDERCWDAKNIELDPSDYEELYNEAQAYRALELELWGLEEKLEGAQEAALAAVRRGAP